jgi:hypothetical protein
MKRIIVALIVAFMFTPVFVSISKAQLAKEGTGSGTNIYTARLTVAPLDKERYAATYECLGVNISGPGEGPFHDMSTLAANFITSTRTMLPLST